MKNASTELINFLNTSSTARIVDLYTLTLVGGQTIRWSSGDVAVFANGHNFELGPAIERSRISNKRGVQASSIEVQIYADDSDKIGNVPLLAYLRAHGLDSAILRIDKAYFDNVATVPIGTLVWFVGRVTTISGLTRSKATIKAADWRILLEANVPRDLCLPACRHSLYDTGCGVNPAGFTASGVVGSTPAPTTTQFDSALTNPTGYFDLGSVTFTSGANAGLKRTVKSYSGTGFFTLMPALPVAPAPGDTFTALPGCDLLKATCLNKFNNLLRHGGAPYVPAPEVAVG